MYLLIIIYILIVGGMYRSVFGPFKLLTIFHLFFLSYIISIVIALPQLDDGSLIFEKYAIAALITPLLFLIGGLFGKPRLFFRLNNKYRYLSFELFVQRKVLAICAAFLIFIIIYTLDVGLNSTGLVYALKNPGDATTSMEMRMISLNSNISPLLTRLYGYSRAFIIPFITGLLLIMHLEKKIKAPLFWVFFTISLIYTALSAAKAPVFYLLLSLALTQYWWKLYNDPSSAYKYGLKLITFTLIGLILSSLFYPLLHGYYGEEAIIYAWDKLNERIFIIPSNVAMRYFENFGYTFDFLGINGSPLLSFLTDTEKTSSAQLLYSLYYSNRFSDQGLMNAAFFAGMYANFGFFGLILGTIFSGFLVSQIQTYIQSLPLTSLSFSCKAICGLAVMQLPLTEFSSVLLGRGLVLLPVLLCISVYITRFLSPSYIDTRY